MTRQSPQMPERRAGKRRKPSPEPAPRSARSCRRQGRFLRRWVPAHAQRVVGEWRGRRPRRRARPSDQLLGLVECRLAVVLGEQPDVRDRRHETRHCCGVSVHVQRNARCSARPVESPRRSRGSRPPGGCRAGSSPSACHSQSCCRTGTFHTPPSQPLGRSTRATSAAASLVPRVRDDDRIDRGVTEREAGGARLVGSQSRVALADD